MQQHTECFWTRPLGADHVVAKRRAPKTEMSLLSFVCCASHRSRIAVIKDDLMCVEMWSYSFLIERAVKIATYLRHVLGYRESAVVAIYGTSNPEVLSAMLGVLAIPGAYMPVDLDRPPASKETLLRRHHVSVVVVELALVEVERTPLVDWLLPLNCPLFHRIFFHRTGT